MTPDEFHNLPYRPCVGIMLINRDGLVWVGRRFDEGQVEHVAPGHEWQMPQGGIDAGEDPIDAAWRELLIPLDAQDSTHHDEKGHKADAQLKQRTVAVLAHVRDLIIAQGCDALVPHARKVLESYLQ